MLTWNNTVIVVCLQLIDGIFNNYWQTIIRQSFLTIIDLLFAWHIIKKLYVWEKYIFIWVVLNHSYIYDEAINTSIWDVVCFYLITPYAMQAVYAIVLTNGT